MPQRVYFLHFLISLIAAFYSEKRESDSLAFTQMNSVKQTWVVVDVGEQLQVRSKACEVGRVSRPLQDDRQLLNALCKRLRRLQLEQRIEEGSESLKKKKE